VSARLLRPPRRSRRRARKVWFVSLAEPLVDWLERRPAPSAAIMGDSISGRPSGLTRARRCCRRCRTRFSPRISYLPLLTVRRQHSPDISDSRERQQEASLAVSEAGERAPL